MKKLPKCYWADRKEVSIDFLFQRNNIFLKLNQTNPEHQSNDKVHTNNKCKVITINY